MTVVEFADKLGGRLVTGETGNSAEIAGVYCCDLLSWVMAHASRKAAWITVHTHLNTVAVATLSELSCIVIPEGIETEEPTVKKAVLEAIPIITVNKSAYEICCIAHDCGI